MFIGAESGSSMLSSNLYLGCWKIFIYSTSCKTLKRVKENKKDFNEGKEDKRNNKTDKFKEDRRRLVLNLIFLKTVGGREVRKHKEVPRSRCARKEIIRKEHTVVSS